jgi:hypothetical protein
MDDTLSSDINGVNMISQSYNISEFIEGVRNKDYWDLILSTDKEATEIQRCLLRPQMADEAKQKGGESYAELLESFVFYLRYGVKHKRVGDDVFVLFLKVREKLINTHSLLRCL